LRQVFAWPEPKRIPQLRDCREFYAKFEQNTLGQIEEHASECGRYYNAVVSRFNTMIEQFPSKIVAGMGIIQ